MPLVVRQTWVVPRASTLAAFGVVCGQLVRLAPKAEKVEGALSKRIVKPIFPGECLAAHVHQSPLPFNRLWLTAIEICFPISILLQCLRHQPCILCRSWSNGPESRIPRFPLVLDKSCQPVGVGFDRCNFTDKRSIHYKRLVLPADGCKPVTPQYFPIQV